MALQPVATLVALVEAKGPLAWPMAGCYGTNLNRGHGTKCTIFWPITSQAQLHRWALLH